LAGKSRKWIAAPSWPEPPPDFTPRPGWQPDPAWGPAPPHHRFWRRTKVGKRRLWLISVGVAVGVLTLGALLGAAVMQLPSLDSLDMTTIRVANDTGHEVILFDCNDDGCLRGYNDAPASPGTTSDLNENAHWPGPIGIADPSTHRLLGCLANLPKSDSEGNEPPNTTVNVSSATPCPSGNAGNATVTFYDPSQQ
jgi:hypothetical protein